MPDIYYIEAETIRGGETRGYSMQVKARTRHGETLPAVVENQAQAWLSLVVDESDVLAYDDVIAGERFDHPYRSATYTVRRNGERIIGPSFTVRPIRPTVGTVTA